MHREKLRVPNSLRRIVRKKDKPQSSHLVTSHPLVDINPEVSTVRINSRRPRILAEVIANSTYNLCSLLLLLPSNTSARQPASTRQSYLHGPLLHDHDSTPKTKCSLEMCLSQGGMSKSEAVSLRTHQGVRTEAAFGCRNQSSQGRAGGRGSQIGKIACCSYLLSRIPISTLSKYSRIIKVANSTFSIVSIATLCSGPLKVLLVLQVCLDD